MSGRKTHRVCKSGVEGEAMQSLVEQVSLETFVHAHKQPVGLSSIGSKVVNIQPDVETILN